MPAIHSRRPSFPVQASLAAVVGVLVGVLVISGLANRPLASNALAGSEAVLEGVLDVRLNERQSDGTHWSATVTTADRAVPVHISHADAHRTDLHGALVDVLGTWAADGSVVADDLEPAEPGEPGAAAGHFSDATLGKGPKVKLEGTLSFAHGDAFERGRKTDGTFLLTARSGEITKVTFKRPPSSKLLGRRVRVTGVREGDRLVVADEGSITTLAAAGGSTGTSSGSHRVAVVLLNFSNDTSQPYTPAFAAGVAFSNANAVAAYYAVNSWGQLTLTGDVYGWVTIPNTNAGCDYGGWATAANTAAAPLGFDPTTYDNVVYAFPQTSCGWAGLATMPGRNSWLNGSGAMNLRVMAHELGHNFGTHHAGDYRCTVGGVPVALSADPGSCVTGEYGDPFSVMGRASHYEHTNFSRANYSWLVNGNVSTVNAAGDYLIAPVEIEGTSVTALRVARTTSQSFTLEFRQPDGSPFDNFSAANAPANGVLIRLTASSTSTRSQTWLVWTHPSATYCECNAALQVGETLADPLSGVSFTVLSLSPAGAMVRVSFGTPTPTSTVAPSQPPSPTATPSPTPSPTATPNPTVVPPPTPSPSRYITAPGNLTASVQRNKRVALSWAPSGSSLKVAGYRIYRNDVLVATVPRTKWTDSVTLAAGDTRTYYVVAFDVAGDVSPPSNLATVP